MKIKKLILPLIIIIALAIIVLYNIDIEEQPVTVNGDEDQIVITDFSEDVDHEFDFIADQSEHIQEENVEYEIIEGEEYTGGKAARIDFEFDAGGGQLQLNYYNDDIEVEEGQIVEYRFHIPYDPEDTVHGYNLNPYWGPGWNDNYSMNLQESKTHDIQVGVAESGELGHWGFQVDNWDDNKLTDYVIIDSVILKDSEDEEEDKEEVELYSELITDFSEDVDHEFDFIADQSEHIQEENVAYEINEGEEYAGGKAARVDFEFDTGGGQLQLNYYTEDKEVEEGQIVEYRFHVPYDEEDIVHSYNLNPFWGPGWNDNYSMNLEEAETHDIQVEVAESGELGHWGFQVDNWDGDKLTDYVIIDSVVLKTLEAEEVVLDDRTYEDIDKSLYEVYPDYFNIGVAVSNLEDYRVTIDSHRHIIEDHFNSVTAENVMKPEFLQPEKGEFDFEAADEIIDLAKDNDMKVRGHTLVWHNQTPDWFFEGTEEEILNNMENHIETVLKHFGNDVYAWDVVNEAIYSNTGQQHEDGSIYRDTEWYDTFGKDFILKAFEKADEVARENNLDIKLFYNDYNAVEPDKRDRIIEMLEWLIEEDAPIDAMGIQGHYHIDWPSIDDIEEAIQMYSDLGLDIHITELDVVMSGAETEIDQADRYEELFELFMEYDEEISNVTFWGLSDDATWKEGEDPLLFDHDHDPKQAFWRLIGE